MMTSQASKTLSQSISTNTTISNGTGNHTQVANTLLINVNHNNNSENNDDSAARQHSTTHLASSSDRMSTIALASNDEMNRFKLPKFQTSKFIDTINS